MNEWITSKSKVEVKQKAMKVWKKHKHYPRIYQLGDEFMFAASDRIKKELNI
ncbi:unnamed protein product [marine sediment metagenome]|uniref:Uncharacterized protein n=1 Tax=marine sediment metagenome TaxID=412755 RepID=X1BA30_9ZZZZ